MLHNFQLCNFKYNHLFSPNGQLVLVNYLRHRSGNMILGYAFFLLLLFSNHFCKAHFIYCTVITILHDPIVLNGFA